MTSPARAARIAGHRDVDLDALPPAARAELGARLYDVHRCIFAGLTPARFDAYVMNAPADRNLLRLFLGPDGAVVGYCAVHRFHRRLSGRDCAVIRAEAGLHPDFRGRGATYSFGMAVALREKLRRPFTPLYFLGNLVHPSSYHLFCKYFPRVYPAPGRTLPAAVRALMTELVDSFDTPAVDPADPMVRDVGWITIETPEETRLSRDDPRPDVRFFRDRNPGYGSGHGLVVVIPLSLPNILGAIARRLAELVRHRLRSRPPRL